MADVLEILVRASSLTLDWASGTLRASVGRDGNVVPVELADVTLLDHFTLPTLAARVLDSFPTADRTSWAVRLEHLRDAGLLCRPVHPDTDAMEPAHGTAETASRGQQALRQYQARQFDLQQCLQLIRSVAREIATDCLAYGPLLFAAESPPAPDVPARAARALAILSSILSDLRNVRDSFIAYQIQLRPSFELEATKVNLGSGGRGIAGWVNVDLFPADLCLNLEWGLPFRDGSVAYIYCCLTLEHLFYRRQALSLLRECLRVLQRGGVIRVVVPNMEAVLRAYVNGDAEFFSAQADRWRWVNHLSTQLEIALAWSGLHFETDHLLGHRMGYDFVTLAHLLEASGFGSVEKCTFMGSRHPSLRIDHHSADAGWGHNGIPINLFVEAARPSDDAPPTTPEV